MAELNLIPQSDYIDACNAVREKDGSTGLILSGELGAKIRAIPTGGGGGIEWCHVVITLDRLLEHAFYGYGTLTAVIQGQTQTFTYKEGLNHSGYITFNGTLDIYMPKYSVICFGGRLNTNYVRGISTTENLKNAIYGNTALTAAIYALGDGEATVTTK